MGSAKRRIPDVRCLRGTAHGSARICDPLTDDARPNCNCSLIRLNPATVLTRADFVNVHDRVTAFDSCELTIPPRFPMIGKWNRSKNTELFKPRTLVRSPRK